VFYWLENKFVVNKRERKSYKGEVGVRKSKSIGKLFNMNRGKPWNYPFLRNLTKAIFF